MFVTRRGIQITSIDDTSSHIDLTGEEDEDVELELKGVKLYVKRGDSAFSEGVIGHVKLLSHRTTLDERLREFFVIYFIHQLSLITGNLSFPA
jgi:hypothetical protein